MKIEINQRVKTPFTKKKIIQLIKQVIKKNNWQISLALVSPLEIKRINKRYRNQNTVTDVLAFIYEKNIGEIVICYSQIKKQARLQAIPIKEEFARILIHGLLHLQGYTDETPKKAASMHRKQEKILKNVKF